MIPITFLKRTGMYGTVEWAKSVLTAATLDPATISVMLT
jgi:hypothetical protein